MTLAVFRPVRLIGSLRVTARVAASRFSRAVARLREARAGWPTLALRWRRKRIRLHKSDRPRLVVERQSATHAHFHLHVDATAGPNDRGGHPYPVLTPGERLFQIIRAFHDRTKTLRSSSIVMSQNVSIASGAADSARSMSSAGWPRVRTVHHMAPSDRSVVMRGPRPNASAEFNEPRAVSSRRRDAEQVQPRYMMSAPRKLVLRRHTERPVDVSTSRAGLNVAPAALGHAPQSPRPLQPVPLAWRTTQRQLRQGADAVDQVTQRPAHAVRSATVKAVDEAAKTVAATAAARNAVVRLADFEPGLVDRLTDDVIRRVERRVRIERERRGL